MKNHSFLKFSVLALTASIGVMGCSDNGSSEVSSSAEPSTSSSEPTSSIVSSEAVPSSEEPISSASEASSEEPSSSEPIVISSEEASSSEEVSSVPVIENTLATFLAATNSSQPTNIITNQTFTLAEADVTLHYNSTLTIEYGASVKMRYAYVYERLNELITGSEEFLTVVSNTVYSEGAKAYDGVEWVYQSEKIITFSGVNLTEETTEYAIEGDLLVGTMKEGQEKAFFNGVDMGVSALSYEIEIAEGKLSRVSLEFSTFVDCVGEAALVRSQSFFTYEEVSVTIPE